MVPRKLGAIVAGAAISAGVLLGTIGQAVAQRDGRDPMPLIERSGCGEVGAHASPTGSNPDDLGIRQDLTVSVPSTALLKVDDRGQVVAVLTNTGCAPRPGDDLYIVRPDGTVERAPTPQMANRRWLGDFTQPGVYVSQTR